jgi:universal stress protein A
MAIYKHILVAIDFSLATEPLIQKAAALRTMCSAEISLIHVVEPMFIDASYDVFPSIPVGLEQEAAHKAGTELVQLGQRLTIPAEQCHTVIGATKHAILQCAKEYGVDLIVIGSHGRQGVALLLGSTANAVLHGASCDVLAVRVGQ